MESRIRHILCIVTCCSTIYVLHATELNNSYQANTRQTLHDHWNMNKYKDVTDQLRTLQHSYGPNTGMDEHLSKSARNNLHVSALDDIIKISQTHTEICVPQISHKHMNFQSAFISYTFGADEYHSDKLWHLYFHNELKLSLQKRHNMKYQRHMQYQSGIALLYYDIISRMASMSQQWTQVCSYDYTILRKYGNWSKLSIVDHRQEERRQMVLIRSYIGRVIYSGRCSLSWMIRVSVIFSINITVHHLSFAIHSKKLYLKIQQEHPRIGTERPYKAYGSPPPGNIYISGNIASVRLIVSEIQSQHDMYLTYQSIQKLPSISSKKFVGRFDYNITYGILHHSEPTVTYILLSRSTIVTIFFTTYWTWNFENITIVITCNNGQQFDLERVGFIDGPWVVDDAQLFPVELLDLRRCTCPMEYTEFRQTKMNMGGLFIERSAEEFNVNGFIEFVASPMVCVLPLCHAQKEQLIPGQILNQHVSSLGTSVLNYTYYIDEEASHQMALSVNTMKLQGYNVRHCDYGGVILAYKDSIHNQYHVALGVYCSPAAVASLLAIANPIYLSRGSLSIIVKSYQYLFGLDLAFSVLPTECHGIVAEYVNMRYNSPYGVWDSTAALPHYHVTGKWASHLWCCDSSEPFSLRYRQYFKYNIIRNEGHCLYYQCVPSDSPFEFHIQMETYFRWKRLAGLIFTSQRVSQEKTLRNENLHTAQAYAIASKYIFQINDTNHLTNTTMCTFDLLIAYDSQATPYKRIYFTIQNYTSPAISTLVYINPEDDSVIELDNIAELFFTGDIVKCEGIGYTMRLAIVDTESRCTTTMYDWLSEHNIHWNHVTSLMPKCEQIILKYSPATKNYVLKKNEQRKQSQFLQSLPTMFHTHQVVQNYWILATQYMYSLSWNTISYAIPRESYCVTYLDQVSVFTVYHSVGVLEIGHPQQYYWARKDVIFEDYVTTIPHRLVAQPTHHYSGLLLMSTLNLRNMWHEDCNVSILLSYYSISPYMTRMQYSTDMSQFYHKYEPWYNKWRMCRKYHCYLVQDSSAYPYNMTWTEAEHVCKENQGHVFTANSEAEQSAVIQWVMTKRRRSFTVFYGYLQHYARATVIFLGLRVDQVNTICFLDCLYIIGGSTGECSQKCLLLPVFIHSIHWKKYGFSSVSEDI